MGDATAVLLDGRILLGGAVMALLGVALAPPISSRMSISRPHATALVVSTGMILATTLLNRSSGWFDVARLVRWEPWRWYEFERPDWLLNVALFVPAAAFWTAAVRRPWIVTTVGLVLSTIIEFTQGALRLGTGDQADLAANGLGAAIGAGIGWAWARSHPPSAEPTGWTHHQVIATTVGAALGATLSVFAIGVEADRRVDDVTDVLATSLGGATSTDLAAVWALDDPAALAHFTTAFGVDADVLTRVDGSDHVVLRYPIEFFGARRCIYADIGLDGTGLTDGSGAECDDPLGAGR